MELVQRERKQKTFKYNIFPSTGLYINKTIAVTIVTVSTTIMTFL